MEILTQNHRHILVELGKSKLAKNIRADGSIFLNSRTAKSNAILSIFHMSATSSKMVTWDDVFAGWRNAEEEIWRQVYEGFGWETWDAWRRMMIADLNLEKRQWTEAIITHPHDEIPRFAIGGWNEWKKYRSAGKDIASFAIGAF